MSDNMIQILQNAGKAIFGNRNPEWFEGSVEDYVLGNPMEPEGMQKEISRALGVHVPVQKLRQFDMPIIHMTAVFCRHIDNRDLAKVVEAIESTPQLAIGSACAKDKRILAGTVLARLHKKGWA